MINKKTVYIEAAFKGCFSASLDCNYYKELFVRNGYTVVSDPHKAVVILLAMCTGENKAYALSTGLFNRLIKQRREGAQIIIGGCLTASEKKDCIKNKGCFSFIPGEEESLARYLNFETFFTNDNIRDNLDVHDACLSTKKWIAVRKVLAGFRCICGALRLPASALIGRILNVTRTYSEKSCVIRVSKGCSGKCTYCVERSARGPLHSRPIARIVAEIEERLRLGYNHFTIVSDDVGYYGLDIGSNFCELIKAVLSAGDDFTLSIRSLNPKCLIERINEFSNLIIPGRITDIESPVQAGNNRILAKMGRGHTREEYINAFKMILAKDPNISIKTHIIIGFADETREEFNDTVQLTELIPIEKCDITYYTVNPGTVSSAYNNCVSLNEMKRRHRMFIYAMTKSFARRLFLEKGF